MPHSPELRFPGLPAEPDPDPLARLAAWIEEARAAGVPEPSAMALATVTPEGRPANRIVICRGVDADGILFFTDTQSAKGRDLAATPWAAALFTWDPPQRQVRVSGPVAPLPAAETEAWLRARPRAARLLLWASEQSAPVADRAELEARVAATAARFAEGDEVPPPPRWGGYRIAAREVELWGGRMDRLHDRFHYAREEGGPWKVRRLMP